MKASISVLLFVICTVVLAAQQSQAKKGCNAYGHACYGGHGKRSLGNLIMGSNADANVLGGGSSSGPNGAMNGVPVPNAALQIFPREMVNNDVLDNGEDVADAYPRYRLINLMKSWFARNARRPTEEHASEFDYGNSAEILNRGNNNAFK